MTAHDWKVEFIDGGPAGGDDFWVCGVCGASGGPVWGDEKGPKWKPFLAGARLDLSEDCVDARLQIRRYCTQAFADLLKNRRDISPKYVDMMNKALIYSTELTNVTCIVDICLDLKFCRYPTALLLVADRLKAAGFAVTMPEKK